MKLAFFDDFKLGLVQDDQVVDLYGAVRDLNPPTPQDLINQVIANFESDFRTRFEEVARSAPRMPLDQVRLRPPLPRPGKIVAMAANYLEHGALKEPRPINAFLKSPECVISSGDTVVLPPARARVFHHEAELGIVIGKEATRIKADQAYEHIFGYVNFIDVSYRVQGSFFDGKCYDTFGPMGPFLVTADEIADPQKLSIQLWVNGELRQDYDTSDMGHSISRTIEWISDVVALEPGDLIAAGTNHQGIGAIQDGDRIEMEIPGLGHLAVRVQDDLKRQWPRTLDPFRDFVAGRTDKMEFLEEIKA